MASLSFFMDEQETVDLVKFIAEEFDAGFLPVVSTGLMKPKKIRGSDKFLKHLEERDLFPFFHILSGAWQSSPMQFSRKKTDDGKRYLEAPLGRAGLSLGFVPSRTIGDVVEPGMIAIPSYFFQALTGWSRRERPASLVEAYEKFTRRIKKGRQKTICENPSFPGPYASRALIDSQATKLSCGSYRFGRMVKGQPIDHPKAGLEFNGWDSFFLHVR